MSCGRVPRGRLASRAGKRGTPKSIFVSATGGSTAMDRFSEIMQTVLKWEGGYVNNPHDRGGPTNYGITHKVLAEWRGVASVTPNQVKNMTKEEAVEIFRHRYWT